MYFKILFFLILLDVSHQRRILYESEQKSGKLDFNAPEDVNTTEYKTNFHENEDTQSMDSKKVLEIYKIIMIFTCCVLAIVLICFLICILRNSDILVSTPTFTQDNLNLNDVYSTSDDNSNNTLNSNNLLINLPFEKPPSYLDVLKEIGQPPPIYQANIFTNQQSNIVTLSSSVQNQASQDELILDCNRWLEQSNNERSSLESRLLESRLAQEHREKLRRLSRDSERCNLPTILSRSHSSPVIRNSQLLRGQRLIDASNELIINTLTSIPLSQSGDLVNECTNQCNQIVNLNSVHLPSQIGRANEH